MGEVEGAMVEIDIEENTDNDNDNATEDIYYDTGKGCLERKDKDKV